MEAPSKQKKKIETALKKEPVHGWKTAARLLEQQGEIKQAVALYESVLKSQPANEYIYDRLMILYRKEKRYRKELSLIKNAIQKFSGLLKPMSKNRTGKIASLSKSILHSVGLTNKKGVALFQPQPIERWEKRGETIRKKLAHA